MALPSYSTGTATIASGETNVALTDGTTAFNNVFAGDTFCIGTASAKVVDVVDDGNFTITPWPGSAESGAAYTVLQDSKLRFTDVEIAIDLKKQVQALNTEGFYIFVPSSASEPDTSLGDDGQYAFQASTGKLWIRESGAWSFLGVYKGFGLPAAYDSGTTYSLFDTATSDGSTYVWINATAGSGHAPPNATYWSVLAGKGDPGAPGATILTQDAEPDTDHPDNSLWIDSDSADLDVYVLTGSPPAWSDTGMNLKGTTGSVAWLPPVAWTTGTDFVEGPPASVVTQGGETYVCLIAHTSGTFATDLSAGKWIKVAAKGTDGTGAGDLLSTNNLSDLADAATARTNLGLGTAATTAASAYATSAQAVPAGGTTGQLLAKVDNTDNNTHWIDAPNTDIASVVHAASSKTTPVDADELPLVDSAASNVLKKLSWANLKAALSSLYAATARGLPSGGTTGQVLTKVDGTDYNTGWVDQSGGGGVSGEPYVLLATGQSNIGAIRDYDWTPPTNLKIWDFDGVTSMTTGTQFLDPDPTKLAVSHAFAAQIAIANPDRTVYLFNVGYGGIPIANWMSAGPPSPDMYAACKANVEAGLTILGVDRIDEMLWWQGESDALAFSRTYPADFETVIARFRAETWFQYPTPIAITGVSPLYSAEVKDFNYILRNVVANEPQFRTFVDLTALPDSLWNVASLLHMEGFGYDQVGKAAFIATRHGTTALTVQSWKVIFAPSHVDIASSTTPVDDPVLRIPTLTGRGYIIRGRIFANLATANGIKWSLSSNSSFPFCKYNTRTGAAPTTQTLGATTFSLPSNVAVTVASSAVGFIEFEVVIPSVPSSGEFKFQWAQNSSSATATRRFAGSYMEYIEYRI